MANPNERILNLQREPLIVGTGGAVNSVNGQTGDVVLTAEDVGALPDSTVIPTKTSDLENDSDYQTGDEVNQAIGLETTARENADNSLQSQIDGLAAASDVTDIVGTYADLQAYDTSTLGDNNIIKVLQDEEHNNETTYYRWSTSTQTFTLIGEEGPYYTKAAADQKFQDKLTAGSNITIDANNEISATDTTYSNFTGTDGQTAGTAGLVPAPATTDAGKYLKADGTWDTVSAGPNVVQTTGTSQTDVMSQVATSNMIFPSGHETNKDNIVIGKAPTKTNSLFINSGTQLSNYIGSGTMLFIGRNSGSSNVFGSNSTIISINPKPHYYANRTEGMTIIGYGAGPNDSSNTVNYSTALGSQAYFDATAATSLGASAKAYHNYSVALGVDSNTGRAYEVSIGSGAATNGTRYIANVTDPTLAQDAATKNYVDTQVGNIETILQTINSGQGVGA